MLQLITKFTLQITKFANKDIKEDECFKDGGWIVAVPGGNWKIFLRGGICQSSSSEEEEVEGTKVDEIEKDGIL